MKALKIIGQTLLWVIAITIIVNVLGFVVGLFNPSSWWPFQIQAIEQVSLDNGLKGKTNGGFTFEELEKFREDEQLPYYDDVFKDFYVKETEDYVVLFRKVEKEVTLPLTNIVTKLNTYPNLSFIKTSNGLIWDGAWGIKTDVPVNWATGVHDFSKAETTLNVGMNSYGTSDSFDLGSFIPFSSFRTNYYENIVTFSDFRTSFAPDYWDSAFWNSWFKENETNKLYNYIHTYLYENVIDKYFLDITDLLPEAQIEFFTGVENVNNSALILGKINSFATYLWNNSKTEDKIDNNSLLDISDYYINIIPEDLQENYPIPQEKLAEYGDVEFYPTYISKIFANVQYSYDSVTIIRNNEEAQEKVKYYSVEPTPEVTTEYAQLQVTLNNAENSNLSDLDLSVNPVIITFGDKTLKFNDKTKLTKSIALEMNIELFYTIDSSNLIFDVYSGTITLENKNSTKTFDFEYTSGFIPTSISLTAISSSGQEYINLADFPVTIVFTGNDGEGTYEFVFDNNSKLNIDITKYVKIGSYTYSILSEQLIFGSTSGNIEITSTERRFIFTYAVDTMVGTTLNLDLEYSTRDLNPDYLWSDIVFSIVNQSIVFSQIGGNFDMVLKIYDLEDYELINRSYEMNIENYVSSGLAIVSNGVLINGQNYVAQMLIISVEDSSIFYVSNLVEFTFDSSMINDFKLTPTLVLV